MKIHIEKKQISIAILSFLVIVASISFFSIILNFSSIWGFISKISGILTPFFYGFALAYLINPILHFFEDKFLVKISNGKMKAKTRRGIGILISYLVVLIAIIIFLWVVIPQVGNSIYGIGKKIPEFLATAESWVNDIISNFNKIEISSTSSAKITAIIENIIKISTQMMEQLLPHIISTTKQITSGFVNVIVGIIISIYVLLSKEKFFAQIKKSLYAFLENSNVDKMIELAHSSHKIFSGFILGKLLDSLIIGIICFVCMSIFRMPYAMLISVIVGVTNVIPYFGPFIGAIPSIILILLVDPIAALGFGIFILLLQQFDGNILGPKILGDSTGISAFWVIFSVMLFGGLYGFLGMFLGVPVFAVFYALFRANVEYRLKQKGMSKKTSDYSSEKHPII